MYHSSESQTSNLPGIVSGQGLAGGQRRDDTPGASWICGPAPSAVGATGSTGPVYGATGFNATTPDSKLAKVKTPSATLEAIERAFPTGYIADDKSIESKLDKILEMMVVVVNGITALTTIVKKSEQREWYSTQEFAELVGKAEFTVREWCRLGRIRGKKQSSGRGPNQAWAISHAEIERYRKDGLLERQQPSL